MANGELIRKVLDKLTKIETRLGLLEKRISALETVLVRRKGGEFSPTDVEILKALLEEKKALTAQEIAEKIGRARSSVSLRLNRLLILDLVKKRYFGKRVYWYINPEKVEEIRQIIEKVEKELNLEK